MTTNPEFFKNKKPSELLYQQALDALEKINPDLKDEFEGSFSEEEEDLD